MKIQRRPLKLTTVITENSTVISYMPTKFCSSIHLNFIYTQLLERISVDLNVIDQPLVRHSAFIRMSDGSSIEQSISYLLFSR
jgi:hypothetical protein